MGVEVWGRRGVGVWGGKEAGSLAWSSILPSFLASTVEFVEALTIVLVVGVTINWKSSLLGAAAATLTLAALVAVFGSTLVLFIPIEVLRLVIGVILVLFGMQWLKKALLRYSGLKALHDEAAIYENRLRELAERGEMDRGKFNGFGFLTAFKSVLLEGLEVAFIVITFGAAVSTNKVQGVWAASIGAALAFIVVVALGLAVRGPLTKVPENTLKFVVGIMLVTFGTFWAGEGLGVEWPMADLFLFALVAFYLALSTVVVARLKVFAAARASKADTTAKADSTGKAAARPPVPSTTDPGAPTIRTAQPVAESAAATTLPVAATLPASAMVTRRRSHFLVRVLKEVFDFFCGDWRIFWGVAVSIVLVEAMRRLGGLAHAVTLAGLVFVVGVSVSLVAALRREITA